MCGKFCNQYGAVFGSFSRVGAGLIACRYPNVVVGGVRHHLGAACAVGQDHGSANDSLGHAR